MATSFRDLDGFRNFRAKSRAVADAAPPRSKRRTGIWRELIVETTGENRPSPDPAPD